MPKPRKKNMMAPMDASMMFFNKIFCVFLGDTRPASSIAKPVCICVQYSANNNK